MAEGKLRAAENRRQAEEESRRKARERMVTEDQIIMFNELETKVETFYRELTVLSKKNPDLPLNRFKLKFLNDVLSQTTQLLGDRHRPFPDFEMFDDADLPSVSDAVLMLSHYSKALAKFKSYHSII